MDNRISLENDGQPDALHADNPKPPYVRVPVPGSFSRKARCLVLLAALIVNAAVVLVVLPQVAGPVGLSYSLRFEDLYDLIAKNLSDGNGYRVEANLGSTMVREPGYPILLAAVFALVGEGIQQARIACVLLAFGASLILLRLAGKITGDPRIGMAAAILFLLYPGILVAEARAGIEVPSIFTVALFMLALHSAVETGKVWWYWVSGLLLGVAVLVRSEVLLFPALLLVYLPLCAKGWIERRRVVEGIGVLVLGAVVAMSPWIVRNYILVHQLVPSATVAGIAAQEGLYTCENAAVTESFVLGQTHAGFERVEIAKQLGNPFIGPYYQLFYAPQDEIAFNRALLNHVSAKYRSDPALLAGCAAKNVFFNFWFLGKTQQSTLLNLIVQLPLLGLAIAGAVILRKRGLLKKAGIVVLYILYIPAVHAPIIAHTRHSMLVVPFLAILAGTALVCILRKTQNVELQRSI